MKLSSGAAASLAVTLVATLSVATPPASAAAHPPHPPLARQTLPAGDGWASAGTGTTGGSAAPKRRTCTPCPPARNSSPPSPRPVPKIIYVRGTIDGNTDAAGAELSCADYADQRLHPGRLPRRLRPGGLGPRHRAVRPAGGRPGRAPPPSRPPRSNSRSAPNTTIVGLGRNAVLTRRSTCTSTRSTTSSSATSASRTPPTASRQWDPTDGDEGNWNSLYDNISVTGSTHVWVDHNTFTDGDNPDSTQPVHFGRPYQVHDGQLDITSGSDLVTASWNSFTGHDKTMLIGSTNTLGRRHGQAEGHRAPQPLRQRRSSALPRVRFGQVHVYNNYYEVPDAATFVYALGVGVQSQIFAENNFFRLGRGVDPASCSTTGAARRSPPRGNVLRVGGRSTPIDLLAVYNAAHDPDLSAPTRAGPPPCTPGSTRPPSVRLSVSQHAGVGEVR